MKIKKGLLQRLIIMMSIFVLMAGSAVVASASIVVPKLSMEGIQVVENNGTYQVVYTLKLEGEQVSSLGFTMQYDKTILTPSAASDNSALSEADDTMFNLDSNLTDMLQDPDNGDAMYMLMPSTDCSDPSGKYEYLEFSMIIDPDKVNPQNGIVLGEFSFQIATADALSNLSLSDLQKIFALYNPADVSQGFSVTYGPDDTECTTPGDFGPNIDLELQASAVTAHLLNNQVTAEAVYGDGTVNDLFNYVAANSNTVTVTYIDGNNVQEPWAWNPADMQLAVGETYDCKGGTYHISQSYGDTGLTVEVEVVVSPINLLKFVADPVNLDYIGYQPADKPAALTDLNMPTMAKPQFDRPLVNPISSMQVGANSSNWVQTNPDPAQDDFFTNGNAQGEYTFSIFVDTSTLPAWVTTTAPAAGWDVVNVIRYVGDMTDDPANVSAVVDANGNLVITVPKLGANQVPSSVQKFMVRLPDGTDVDDSGVTFSVDGTTGVATVTVAHNALPTTGVAQAINLGGQFSIAAQDNGKGRSGFVGFTVAPRVNSYMASGSASGDNYEFDYTGTNKGLFPVAVGTTPQTTITLPGTDHVKTTYDGSTGLDGGKLQTVTVSGWLADKANPLIGDIVTFTGTLADASYTGYGDVKNTATPPIKVVLKVEIVAAAQYSVTVTSSNTALGTAQLSGNTNIFTAGDTVTVSYSETVANTFKRWDAVPNTLVLTPTAVPGEYTFTMPMSNVSLKAVFEENQGLQNLSVRDTMNGGYIYDMHSDATLGNVTAFDPADKTYFVRVANTVDKISVWLESDSLPVVAYDDNTGVAAVGVNVTADQNNAKLYKTDAISLAEVDQALGAPDHIGFNNTVTVTVGTDVYTIHIQRLRKPEIKLNYGNSPYGMIMKSTVIAEADKAAAKAAFLASDSNNLGNLSFGTVTNSAYIPTDQFTAGNDPAANHYMDYTKSIYTTVAWDTVKDSNGAAVNYDLDDYAIFVYYGNKFQDPGFIAIDELGNDVSGSVQVSDLTNIATYGGGVAYDARNVVTVKQYSNNNNVYDLTGQMIRTDVYKITYSYNGTTVERPVIIMGKLGDLQMSSTPTVNNQDATAVDSRYSTWKTELGNLKNAVQPTHSGMSLFVYRLANPAYSSTATVNNQDATWINSRYSSKKSEFIQYYSLLTPTSSGQGGN